MDNNYNKVISVTLLVLAVTFMIAGSTFAYFSATINSNGNNISGSTFNFNANMNITSIKSGNLIPVNDSLIDDTLNSTHICTDTRGYGLCSLYRITVVNSGDPITMSGNLKTKNTTYTSNNLKYQLFTLNGSTYSAISDMKSVPAVNTASAFTLNSSNITFNLNSGSENYYLVIWLSDPGSNQLMDSDKTYNGSVTFTASNGNSIFADFS